MRLPIGLTTGVIISCIFGAVAHSGADDNARPSNIVPDLTLSYTDPGSGERFECSDDCRRFVVPAGTILEVQVRVRDASGKEARNDVTWDLWFNQPNHPFPGFDLEGCFDEFAKSLDRNCWQELRDRVDRKAWDGLPPDVVCVPESDESSCREGAVRVVMDPEFEGARRTGVYHFAVWANRFEAVPEWDEFDNFAGPIRVTVEPVRADAGHPSVSPQEAADESSAEVRRLNGDAAPPLLRSPSAPMPYGVVVVPEEVEASFTVTSKNSQRLLEFAPAHPGTVEVEVIQTGVLENMIVEVRKVSTGEVLVETRGKGRLRLSGAIDEFHLKDDPTFEVVVRPGQGSRGIRASVRVSYPARLRYMVDQ